MSPAETHPAALVTLREHDDDGTLLLQHHLPEVVAGLGQRALSGDVLFAVFVALERKPDMVTMTLKHQLQVDPGPDLRGCSWR